MAVTLIDAAKLAMGRDETLLATIMEIYARSSDLLQHMPFQDIPGGALVFNREATLPTAGFRGVNEAYTEGTGKTDKITESLAIAGGDVDVDTMLVNTGSSDMRAVQETMKIKALSLATTRVIIKGDVEATPKEFDGLQVRCTGDQVIDGGTSSGGDVLSLSKLDEAIDACEEATHLLMNEEMKSTLSAAARLYTVGGFITYDQDAFGRRVTFYNDLPILIADKDNNNAEILPFTEDNPGGGTAASTSIYVLSFAENGFVGIQNGVMKVRDLSEIDEKPVFRTRIEWYVSIAILRAKAVARLRGIKVGAVAV